MLLFELYHYPSIHDYFQGWRWIYYAVYDLADFGEPLENGWLNTHNLLERSLVTAVSRPGRGDFDYR